MDRTQIPAPTATNIMPTASPVRVSKRPCPYGWSSSAGFEAIHRPNQTNAEVTRSPALSSPSETTATELALKPTAIFNAAKVAATRMLTAAARVAVLDVASILYIQCWHEKSR